MFINAIQIYRNAVYMLEGIDSAINDRDPGQLEALTSIIYAAIALETFINELPALVGDMFLDSNAPSSLRTFVGVLDELEQSKASINTKYLLGKFILSGESFDKSQKLYQNFALLVSLRNEIVHQKPDDYRFGVDEKGAILRTERQILKRLRSLNVLGTEPSQVGEEGPEAVVTDWLDIISTRATAKWACESASSMILAIVDALPQGTLRDFADTIYRSELTRISKGTKNLME